MSNNNRNSHCENTRAVVRSAIRDSKASSVQARIRLTRIERDMAQLRHSKSCAPDREEASRIELKLKQCLQLREQVTRSLASVETHLQELLQVDQKAASAYPSTEVVITSKQSIPIASDI